MIVLLTLVVLAVAVTVLSILLLSRGARARAGEFRDPSAAASVADVSDPRPHLDAIVRTGPAVDRVHVPGVWTSQHGDHTRIRPKHVKGIHR
jgi:hypothetical protein